MKKKFDVFLSHNSRDKPAVLQLAEALRASGIRVWLDAWELVPGQPWQEAIEEVIERTKAAVVLVGRDGLGPWEIPEMRGCLQEYVRRRLPVIPVLMPGTSSKIDLPLFLRSFTWVDLRSGVNKEGLNRLIWGITGKKEKTALSEAASVAIQRMEDVPVVAFHAHWHKRFHSRWHSRGVSWCFR